MGSEFGQGREWSERHGARLASCSSVRPHAGMQRLVRDLNLPVPRHARAARSWISSRPGFAWIDCHDADAVGAQLRAPRARRQRVVVVLNFTPVPRHGYRIGVPTGGAYRERLNSDSRHYGGSDAGNRGVVTAEAVPANGQPASLLLVLPPLAGLVLARA